MSLTNLAVRGQIIIKQGGAVSESQSKKSEPNTPPSSTTTQAKPSFKVDEDRAEDAALATLSGAAEKLRDERNEERFLFWTAIIVLLNVIFFAAIETWSGALVIGVIELIGLTVLARRLGIEEVQELTTKILDRTAERIAPNGNDKKDS